jgi:hypothetical protein
MSVYSIFVGRLNRKKLQHLTQINKAHTCSVLVKVFNIQQSIWSVFARRNILNFLGYKSFPDLRIRVRVYHPGVLTSLYSKRWYTLMAFFVTSCQLTGIFSYSVQIGEWRTRLFILKMLDARPGFIIVSLSKLRFWQHGRRPEVKLTFFTNHSPWPSLLTLLMPFVLSKRHLLKLTNKVSETWSSCFE